MKYLFKVVSLIILLFFLNIRTDTFSYYQEQIGNYSEEYHKKLLEEHKVKMDILRETLDKDIEEFQKLDKFKLDSFTISDIKKIFNNFKNDYEKDIFLKNEYQPFYDEMEETLKKKIEYDEFQKYLSAGDKYDLKNLSSWKSFMSELKKLKSNKALIKDKIKKAESYTDTINNEKALKIYNTICNRIKLFECNYGIAKIYKKEMLGYSEEYNSSYKKEKFIENKENAIKYLKESINSYNKELFLEETDISMIKNELKHIKEYSFKGNIKDDKIESISTKDRNNKISNKNNNKKISKENKMVDLFFIRLDKFTEGYSYKKKSNLYKLLIHELNKIKKNSTNQKLIDNIDLILIKLEKI